MLKQLRTGEIKKNTYTNLGLMKNKKRDENNGNYNKIR